MHGYLNAAWNLWNVLAAEYAGLPRLWFLHTCALCQDCCMVPFLPTIRLCCPTLTPLLLPLFASWALTEPRGPPVPVCAIVTHKWRSCSSSTLAAADGGAVLVQVPNHDRQVLGATRPTQHTTGQGLAQLGGSCLLGDSLCGGRPAGSPDPNHKRAP